MNKRGLSAIVTTLLVILLVLVAVGIVWGVVRNVIVGGAEEISLGKLTLNLEISNVQVGEDGIDVVVTRNVGAGELKGINFAISDGVNTVAIKKPSTMVLGSETFSFTNEEFAEIAFVKEITIVPVLETQSGREIFGGLTDVEELSNKKIIENLGGVSWWKLDGNAQDEIGGNHGTLGGGVQFIEDGVRGKVASFDGVDGSISIGDLSASIAQNGPATIGGWFYFAQFAMDKGAQIQMHNQLYQHLLNNHFYLGGEIGGQDADFFGIGGSLSLNTWYHIVIVYYGTHETAKLYINGDEYPVTIQTADKNHAPLNLFRISNTNFPGLIDEVMIFDRVLSQSEIKGIYELD